MPQYRSAFSTICSTRMGCLKNAFSGLSRFARLKTHKQLRRRQSEHLERLENVADWKYHAQFFEIDMTDQRSLRPRAVLGQRTKDHS